MAQAFVQIEHRPWRRNGRWMSMALGLVFAILLVQAISYSGLIERLAEREFSRFGRYFPVLTIGALVGLFAAAWVAVVALRRRLTNRTAPPPSVPLDMGRLESARRILIALSLLAGAVALVGAVQYLRAPSMAATHIRLTCLARVRCRWLMARRASSAYRRWAPLPASQMICCLTATPFIWCPLAAPGWKMGRMRLTCLCKAHRPARRICRCAPRG
ncbi:MAG: hypothetical protein ACKOUM_09580 [Sphingopyxis sp.]